MEFMRDKPDKFYKLAIVDPPYGGGQHFNFRYGTGDQVYDSHKPDPSYFLELFRVSENQIVWGGNYFTSCLPENRCWISWYKGNPVNTFSDFELAWTSFDKVSKAVKIESYGFNHADKRRTHEPTIHPTQKPIQLYHWLLQNYAKPDDNILDTHGGSMSSAIACDMEGFDLDICEIDKEYFDAGVKRFENYKQQLTIF
jgi:site-specific DNA-methyltransferase (adenine-specific)